MKLRYIVYQGEDGWEDKTILVDNVFIIPGEVTVYPKHGCPFMIKLDTNNVYHISIEE